MKGNPHITQATSKMCTQINKGRYTMLSAASSLNNTLSAFPEKSKKFPPIYKATEEQVYAKVGKEVAKEG